jgi:hypothetical protein
MNERRDRGKIERMKGREEGKREGGEEIREERRKGGGREE